MKRKLDRELTHLMGEMPLPFGFRFGKKSFEETFPEYKKNTISSAKEIEKNNFYPKIMKVRYSNLKRIFEISKELGLSDEEVRLKWAEITNERTEQKNSYKGKPIPEGRDNKGIYVGNGGSNGNKVRYPSKKRPKRTWKIFYQMFPRLAERDGWDGQTSKRMK